MEKLLLYCTKAKPYLSKEIIDPPFIENEFCLNARQNIDHNRVLNGKIVAECDCEKVEKISCCCVPYRNNNNLGYEYFIDNGVYKVEWKENINLVDKEKRYNNPENYKKDGVVFERSDRYIDTMFKNDDLEKAKITPQELLDYIGLGNDGYVLYLSNVKVLNNPLQFEKDFIYKDYKSNALITKAPQNMCNVYDRFGNHYVLISIQPQHLCKILNGEKTVEVRKVILNALKELINKYTFEKASGK